MSPREYITRDGRVRVTTWKAPGVILGQAGTVEHVVLETRLAIDEPEKGREWP